MPKIKHTSSPVQSPVNSSELDHKSNTVEKDQIDDENSNTSNDDEVLNRNGSSSNNSELLVDEFDNESEVIFEEIKQNYVVNKRKVDDNLQTDALQQSSEDILNFRSDASRIANDDFDTRSEATSGSMSCDNDSENKSDDDWYEYESSKKGPASTREISPIIFNRSNSSDDGISPPGESESVMPKRTIVIPPAEIRAQRRDRHNKMLKYLFRDARFFVIKSNNHENVAIAKSKDVWSTPPSNEGKLNRAFQENRNVILIFSVRESGAFQGFARVTCEARHDFGRINWVLPVGLSAKALGGVFKIDWLCKRELSFMKTTDIRNQFNGNKPVKIGRDGQEIEPNAGKVLCLEFPHDDGVDLEDIIHKVRIKEKESGQMKYESPQYPIGEKYDRYKSREHGSQVHHGPMSVVKRQSGSSALRYSSHPYKQRRFDHEDMRLGGKNKDLFPRHERGGYSWQNSKGYTEMNYKQQTYSEFPAYRGISSSYANFPYLYKKDEYAARFKYSYSYEASGQPSSAVITKYSSGTRSSVRSYDSNNHNKHSNYSSSSSRLYDSRAHAAACDDFVRRVASGKSAIVPSPSTNIRADSGRYHRKYPSSKAVNRH